MKKMGFSLVCVIAFLLIIGIVFYFQNKNKSNTHLLDTGMVDVDWNSDIITPDGLMQIIRAQKLTFTVFDTLASEIVVRPETIQQEQSIELLKTKPEISSVSYYEDNGILAAHIIFKKRISKTEALQIITPYTLSTVQSFYDHRGYFVVNVPRGQEQKYIKYFNSIKGINATGDNRNIEF